MVTFFHSLPEPWKLLLKDELKKPYIQELSAALTSSYDQRTIYPPKPLVFSAFEYCVPEDCKVVVIGQDPYHAKGQANGMSFSVSYGVDLPPSLKNIFLEIQKDTGLVLPFHGDLSGWANQGVLLLNAALTVPEKSPGAHQRIGWLTFTKTVVSKLSKTCDSLVFLLWGNFAKSFAPLIDKDKHYILESGHPSPLSANRGFWFDNHHFSKTNIWLIKQRKTPIDWGYLPANKPKR